MKNFQKIKTRMPKNDASYNLKPANLVNGTVSTSPSHHVTLAVSLIVHIFFQCGSIGGNRDDRKKLGVEFAWSYTCMVASIIK